MKRIIYTKPDGSTSIVTPVINTMGEIEGFTEEDAIKRAWDRLPEDAINPFITEAEKVPTDRTFRNAWTVSGNTITHDMGKSREIHRNKMREARKPKMESLDIEYQRADETGNIQLKLEIAAKKQALRDVTSDPRIEIVSTPEELKAVWPDIIK